MGRADTRDQRAIHRVSLFPMGFRKDEAVAEGKVMPHAKT